MMTLEEKIGQMLLVGFEGTEAPEHILNWLREGKIGGVILFVRNIGTPQQLAALTRQIHEAARFPALIAIDQEGGTVARLRQGYTESPGAMALSASGSEDLTERVSLMMAREMRAMGINWTYAPVVDISYNAENPTVSTRSFGSDRVQVGRMAAAAVRGFQRGGVAACAKHFPGLGDTPVDTHFALPALDTPVDHLLENDLPPYRDTIAAGLSTIMTTHTIYSALDPDLPATLSPVIIQRLLRDELGFDGVVTTDCMEMKAISDNHPPEESATLAALAGVDLILVSHTVEAQERSYKGLLEAARSGRLPASIIDAANARIAALKESFKITAAPDLSAIRSAEHVALAQQAARAGSVLLREAPNALPLPTGRTALVEFILQTSVVESSESVGAFSKVLHQRLPDLQTLTLHAGSGPDAAAAALAAARDADVLVLATRSIHLHPKALELARKLIAEARQVVLVCLRNPYDAAALPEAPTVICTCGDSTPSLDAAADALMGVYRPGGRLPVTLEPLLS